MLKGVSKMIVEVNNPDSVYFERAIFYLRPNVRELPGEISDAEISRYIAGLGLEFRKKRRSAIVRRAVIGGILVLCTAAVLFALVR